jgi:phosphoglycerate-specific signal transduction histidine kinase
LKDENKTKMQLLTELNELRRQIAELSESQNKYGDQPEDCFFDENKLAGALTGYKKEGLTGKNFFEYIAHQIVQPLNAIKLTVDGMLFLQKKGRTFGPEEITEELTEISRQTERINKIINQMRYFSNTGCQNQ